MKYLRLFKNIEDYEKLIDELPYQCVCCIKEENKKPKMIFPKYNRFIVQDGIFNVEEGEFFVLGVKS